MCLKSEPKVRNNVYFRMWWWLWSGPLNSKFKTHLLTIKAKVGPIDGLTIPRSELSVMQILVRIIAKIAKTFPDIPGSNHILGGINYSIWSWDRVAHHLILTSMAAHWIFIII